MSRSFSENNGVKFSRHFGMASKDTFDCKPIKDFVRKYIEESEISIDPFARNKEWATYTNDLNPDTKAEFHMKAVDFLNTLITRGVKADLVIFDPPYSMEQCKRSYERYGYKFTYEDSLYVIRWTREKNLITDVLNVGGIFLHFGWHTNGMGFKRGCKLEELMIVHHGGSKYDTLCLAERKMNHQRKFPFKERRDDIAT